MTTTNLKEELEKTKKLQVELEAKIEEYDVGLRRQVGDAVTRDMLREGTWSPRETMPGELVLDGRKGDFPSLAKHLGVLELKWFQNIPFIVDNIKYWIIDNGDAFIMGLERNRGLSWEEEQKITDHVLPLTKKFGLRLNFDEISKHINFDKLALYKLESAVEHLALTQCSVYLD